MNKSRHDARRRPGRWALAAAVAIALTAAVVLSRYGHDVEAMQVEQPAYPGIPSLPPPPPRLGLIRVGAYYINMEQIQYVLVESNRPNAERVRVQFIGGGGGGAQLLMTGPNARGLIGVLDGGATPGPDRMSPNPPNQGGSPPSESPKIQTLPSGSEVEAELIPPPEDLQKDYERDPTTPKSSPPLGEVPKSR